MKNLLFLSFIFFAMCTTSAAALQTKEVEYASGGTTMKGFLVHDDSMEGKRPGILVVHEWWGLNDYARKRAEMLARLGYTAMAVDMYGEGKTAGHPDEAGKFSAEVKKNMDAARERFQAAKEVLQNEETVDGNKIAAIGYCFGGGVVLEMARAGFDLDGVVSFHGSLATDNPAQPGNIKARVLVLNGADDPMVKPEEIEAFKKEMEAAGVDYQFINYPDAKHSFTNPGADKFGEEFGLPLQYNQNADKESWQAMQDFFKEIFK
ncbi:MAG: dienelactone hydrolase family protein [Desulfobulbaceae bacterium]|nr:dienelactone hydrolase family protein [Desulfobulbaceae bacterium]